MANRKWQPWTPEDDEVIATQRVEVAAQLLGRTVSSIHRRRFRAGITGSTPCSSCDTAIPRTGRSGRPSEFCSDCVEKRRPELLEKRRETWRRFHHRNREQRNAQHREYILLSKYGITGSDYDSMLREQNGVCAICGSETSGHGAVRFHVDHDHLTGAVRGLLCGSCNIALGKFGDDPAVLRAAASYVERHRIRRAV